MKLIEHLAKRNLTQAAFAKVIGYHKASITRWIRGQRKPRAEALRLIDQATNGEVGAGDF